MPIEFLESYSLRRALMRSATARTVCTPETEWPADQMSFHRFGRVPGMMSVEGSIMPRLGNAAGSRPASSMEDRSMLDGSPVKALAGMTLSSSRATSVRL